MVGNISLASIGSLDMFTSIASLIVSVDITRDVVSVISTIVIVVVTIIVIRNESILNLTHSLGKCYEA